MINAVQSNSIEATVNNILKQWRDLWPGGLSEEQYSTLNLMAHCRRGELGYNRASCGHCNHHQWYASSCGDRHCPMCLGPRQAKWSQEVCRRLPDCPHFHVVFSLPAELWEFFRLNYRVAANEFFAAAAETLKTFQKNNWKCEQGSFFSVLHTWGSRLNWHPHLHMLVSAGGIGADGAWKPVRGNYLFPLKAMSKVFGAIFLRRLEQLDSDRHVKWPQGLDSLEERRQWRVMLCGRFWNIFAKPTLGNTRAVVRYLARYTSRIAISNRRLTRIDTESRQVSFKWTDYRAGGQQKEESINAATFLRRFVQHLVPKRFRRVRYYGLLAGAPGRFKEALQSPRHTIGENDCSIKRPACPQCGHHQWCFTLFIPMVPAPTCSALLPH